MNSHIQCTHSTKSFLEHTCLGDDDVVETLEKLTDVPLLSPLFTCVPWTWGGIFAWPGLASLALDVESRPLQLISLNRIFYKLVMRKGELWNRNFCHNTTSLVTRKHLQNKCSCKSELITMQMSVGDIIYSYLISFMVLVHHLSNFGNERTPLQGKEYMAPRIDKLFLL